MVCIYNSSLMSLPSKFFIPIKEGHCETNHAVACPIVMSPFKSGER